MVEFKAQLFTSVVVRNKEGKYLSVLENHDRGWWLPCGHVEERENFIQCGIRETKEEAGIDIEVKGVLRLVHMVKENNKIRLTMILYAEPKDQFQEPKQFSDEHSQLAKWFSKEELIEISHHNPGFREKDFLEWVKYLENGGEIFPLSVIDSNYSDFKSVQYEKSFTITKILSNPIKLRDKYEHFIFRLETVNEHIQNLINLCQQTTFITSYPKQYQEYLFKGIDQSLIKIQDPQKMAIENLKEQYKEINKVLVIGQDDLVQDLQNSGIECKTLQEDGVQMLISGKAEDIELDHTIQAIIIGWDPNFDFYKSFSISRYYQKGVKLIAISNEKNFQIGDYFMPGTQAILDMVASSLNMQTSDIEVIGNFNERTLNFILSEQLDKSKVLVVSNNVNDINIAFKNNIDVCSINTGDLELNVKGKVTYQFHDIFTFLQQY